MCCDLVASLLVRAGGALDITKNQASNALAAEETEVQVEKETEVESNKTDVDIKSAKVTTLKSTPRMHVAMAH